MVMLDLPPPAFFRQAKRLFIDGGDVTGPEPGKGMVLWCCRPRAIGAGKKATAVIWQKV